MGIGSTIGQVAQPTQSAPQPMGGKGGIVSRLGASAGNAFGKTYGAQEPIFAQPAAPQPSQQGQLAQEPNTGGVPFDSTTGGERRPNFMGGKGGGFNPYAGQPSMPRFTEMRPDSNQPTAAGMIYQGPYVDNSFLRAQREARMASLQNQAQQPLFDANTTQAEFDRARGITPAAQPTQPGQAAQPASGAEEAFRNATRNAQFAPGTDMEAVKRDFMNQYNQRDALKRQYAMPGQDYRSVNPVQIEQMRQMQQPQFMGGKGGGFNPYAGGYGGGFNPYAGGYGGGFNPYAGGLGGLAALMQGRQFKDGGEVK